MKLLLIFRCACVVSSLTKSICFHHGYELYELPVLVDNGNSETVLIHEVKGPQQIESYRVREVSECGRKWYILRTLTHSNMFRAAENGEFHKNTSVIVAVTQVELEGEILNGCLIKSALTVLCR